MNRARGFTASPRPRHGFTLVELLVVIAIIGVLVALLLPAVQQAREAARRTQCANNVKQLSLGVILFTDAHKEFPTGGITPGACCSTKSFTNWAIETLPYIEHQALYDQYRQRPVTNEDASNQEFVQTKVAPHACPSDMNTDTIASPSGPGSSMKYRMSSYRGCAGRLNALTAGVFTGPTSGTGAGSANQRGVLPFTGYLGMTPVKLRSVTDGMSKTLLIGESVSRKVHNRNTFWAYSYASHNKAEVYAEARSLLDDYDDCVKIDTSNTNACKRAWSSQHPGGFHFSFCDGSVALINSDVDIFVLADMASMAGGETVEPF